MMTWRNTPRAAIKGAGARPVPLSAIINTAPPAPDYGSGMSGADISIAMILALVAS